jgi:orotate phosphoribosyltransferase
MKEDIAKLLLKIGAVSLKPKEGFLYVSGRKGPIYCDNRLILSYTNERQKIVNAFVDLIEERKLEFDVVAGVATGAIAWAALVATKTKKPMIYIRGAAKDHGKENLIEGKLEKGQKVLVIEDLVNTGGSSVDACKAVMDAGGKVVACVAVFTYNHADAHKKFSDAGIALFTLSDFDALVKAAISKKYISEEDKKSLDEWHNAPKEWMPK